MTKKRGEFHLAFAMYRLAKAFKLESDFETSIFRCGFVKILVNPQRIHCVLCLAHQKILYLQNSATLKVRFYVWILVKRSK